MSEDVLFSPGTKRRERLAFGARGDGARRAVVRVGPHANEEWHEIRRRLRTAGTATDRSTLRTLPVLNARPERHCEATGAVQTRESRGVAPDVASAECM